MTVCLTLAAGADRVHASAAPVRFSADRVVVFGDVHGAYDQLVRLLRASGVVDGDLAWSAGTTHLVSLGDILDRGPDARSSLDLLIRLQTEAANAGGRVHVVLGNHEVMNLIGDLRYVPEAEFAAFLPDGSTEPAPPPTTASATALQRQPGYAERHAAFAETGVYGRWLLAQPAALIVNDNAFVHGGLPTITAELSAAELDQAIKERLAELLGLRAALEAAGLVAPHGDIQADAAHLKAARTAPVEADAVAANSSPTPGSVDQPPLAPELEAQIQRFITLAEDELLADGGPLWYRGTALCHDLLERPVLEAALANWQVKRVIVGHSPTWDSRIRARFGGLAILADTGMLYEYYRGQPAALIIDDEGTRVLYADRPANLEQPDAREGLEFEGLASDAVERLLAEGDISATSTDEAASTPDPGLGPNGNTGSGAQADAAGSATPQATLPAGATLVTVRADGQSVAALFEPGSRAEIGRQLAAYQLDRLLGLGLAAPVAERTFAGKNGVVSARWNQTIDEQARAAAKLVRSNWCAAGSDYQLMYVFDALIRNVGRTPNNMLYDRRTWQFASAGHAAAFGRGQDLPPYLANAPKVVPAALVDALRRLDEATLVGAIGEWVPKAQVRALLERRDALLATWTLGETPQ